MKNTWKKAFKTVNFLRKYLKNTKAFYTRKFNIGDLTNKHSLTF